MRLRLAAPLAAALVLVPAATAATPGTYRGHLLAQGGERLRDAKVTATVRGDRLALAAVNLRARCPYPDDDGRPTRVRVSLSWIGNVTAWPAPLRSRAATTSWCSAAASPAGASAAACRCARPRA